MNGDFANYAIIGLAILAGTAYYALEHSNKRRIDKFLAEGDKLDEIPFKTPFARLAIYLENRRQRKKENL